MGFSDSFYPGEGSNYLERKDLLSNIAVSRQIIRDGNIVLNRSFIDEVIDQCFESRQFRVALSLIKPVVKLLPSDAGLWLKQGQCYFGLRKQRLAWRAFDRAVSLDTANIDMHLQIGSLCISSDKLRKAGHFFQRAVSLSPTDFAIYAMIGARYRDAGYFRNAVPYFEHALNLRNNDPETLFQLAVCYEHLKEFTTAMNYYDKFLFIEPHSEIGWFNRGILLEKIKNPAEAIQSYQFALNLKEDFFEAHFNLGNLYADQDDYSHAFASFERVIQIAPNEAAAYFNLGALHEDQMNFAKAVFYYSRCLEINPDFQGAYLGRGLCNLRNNSIQASVSDLKEAMLLSIPQYREMRVSPEDFRKKAAKLNLSLNTHFAAPSVPPQRDLILMTRLCILLGRQLEGINFLRGLPTDDKKQGLSTVLLSFLYFSSGNDTLGYCSLFAIAWDDETNRYWFEAVFPAVFQSRFFRELLLYKNR